MPKYLINSTNTNHDTLFIVIAGSSRNKFLKNIKAFFSEYSIGVIDAKWFVNLRSCLNAVKKVKAQGLEKWIKNNDHCRPYIIYGKVSEDIKTLSRLAGKDLSEFFIEGIRDYFKFHNKKYSFSKLRLGYIEWGNCFELYQNLKFDAHSHPYLDAPFEVINIP